MRIITTLILAFFVGNCYSQDQNISSGLFFEGEPYLSVNPQNPQHLVVAWMGFVFNQQVQIKTKVSVDGGNTWSVANNTPHQEIGWTSADPSMVFDNEGKVYLCYIDSNQDDEVGAVYVRKSTDGGFSWGTANEAINAEADGDKLPVDRPWLMKDESDGPWAGTLYITTKPAPWIPAPNRAYIVRSFDDGENWTDWEYIDNTNWLIGNFIAGPMAAPAVSGNGVIHIIYPSFVLQQNFLPQFVIASSTDGGNEFEYHSVYEGTSNGGDDLAKLGYQLICNPANPDHLAFLFIYGVLGDLDVYLCESLNAGNTWTNPLRINDDVESNGAMQDLVWADFDEDGDLAITWRDRRNGSETGYQTESEIYCSVRCVDSIHFEPNFRLSDTQTEYDNLFLSQSGNDFMCVNLLQDTIRSVWGEVRNGALNIYFTKRAAKSDAPNEIFSISSDELPSYTIYPNPAINELNIDGQNARQILLKSIDGKLIKELDFITKIDISWLHDGAYIIEIIMEKGRWIETFIKSGN